MTEKGLKKFIAFIKSLPEEKQDRAIELAVEYINGLTGEEHQVSQEESHESE